MIVAQLRGAKFSESKGSPMGTVWPELQADKAVALSALKDVVVWLFGGYADKTAASEYLKLLSVEREKIFDRAKDST